MKSLVLDMSILGTPSITDGSYSKRGNNRFAAQGLRVAGCGYEMFGAYHRFVLIRTLAKGAELPELEELAKLIQNVSRFTDEETGEVFGGDFEAVTPSLLQDSILKGGTAEAYAIQGGGSNRYSSLPSQVLTHDNRPDGREDASGQSSFGEFGNPSAQSVISKARLHGGLK